MQNRHRGPDDPPAMFGGSECQGPSNDIQECSTGIQCRTYLYSFPLSRTYAYP